MFVFIVNGNLEFPILFGVVEACVDALTPHHHAHHCLYVWLCMVASVVL